MNVTDNPNKEKKTFGENKNSITVNKTYREQK